MIYLNYLRCKNAARFFWMRFAAHVRYGYIGGRYYIARRRLAIMRAKSWRAIKAERRDRICNPGKWARN